MPKFDIAGITIELDAPEWLIHERIKLFKSNRELNDIICRITFGQAPTVSNIARQVLMQIYADSFYDDSGFLHIRNYEKTDIPYYTLISDDWTKLTLFIEPSYNDQKSDVGYVRECLLSQLRELFVPLLARHDGVLLHAASIEYIGRGVLFSAPAGTGKSTHAHLWQEKYGVRILDGDVTACRIMDGAPYAYGLPWCGTSGEFMNKRLPLQAVVFLEQSEHNEIRRLDIAEAVVRLYARCFLFLGSEAMTDQVLKTLESLAGSVDCYVLQCRPDFEAVDLVKQCLDESL